MNRVVITAAFLLVVVSGVRAACPDGEYHVVGDPLLSSPGGAFVDDVVTITDGTFVSIASGCGTVRARIRTTTRGTLVLADWPFCGTARRVRLRATVNKSCRVMHGLFRTVRPRSSRRFVAKQSTSCRASDPSCKL